MKSLPTIGSLILSSFLVSCSSFNYNEPEREDREKALLRSAHNEVSITLTALPADSEFIGLNLKHVRIDIPRDVFPGDPALAEEKLNADEGKLNEALKSFIDLDVVDFLIGIDVFRLELLIREGRVRVYDRENSEYIDSLVMAEYSIYYGPLDSTSGIVFLFPDKKRVIIEIMHWIS